MTCAERLDAIFRGEMVDRVPFVLKGWRIPQCQAERELRNDGLGVLDSRPVYRQQSPNTRTEVLHYSENGTALQRTVVTTPKGTLTRLDRRVAAEQTEGTSWRMEMLFKGPGDYDALDFMLCDARSEPHHGPFLRAQRQMGGDAFFKTTAPGAPIHTLMYQIMGLEAFSVEWAERRDRVLALIDAITRNQRRIYEIIADSPATVVQAGGNYASSVLGRPRFIEHVLPHWEEVGSILQPKGKLLGCHLDADNGPWAAEIAASNLDWIEAFSPHPDTDLTVAQARELWPGKVLFINFPSAVHLSPPDVIRQTTKQMLEDAAPGDRFIIGITENVPEDRWRESFRAILDTANRFGRLPIVRPEAANGRSSRERSPA